MRVTNGIPLGCPLLLPVDTVNCVQTLKVDTRRYEPTVGAYVVECWREARCGGATRWDANVVTAR
jgi:hypothetical protein